MIDIEKILHKDIQKYIKDHQLDDPFLLSLKEDKPKDVVWQHVIWQIQSLQKATNKLPGWASVPGIVWPNPLSLEQCSSEITARYKSEIIKGTKLIDLTGGTGVDTCFLSKNFNEVIFVEQSEELCALAVNNFKKLQKDHIEVINSTAEKFLEDLPAGTDTTIYIDPSRRNANMKKGFKIKDSSPDISVLFPGIMEKCNDLLIKFSPLIDLKHIIDLLSPSDIRVVSVNGDVKEVLCLLKKGLSQEDHSVVAIDLARKEEFIFTREQEKNASSNFSDPKKYLYEPNSVILKAGAFKLVGERFNIEKLHTHTHLYTSDHLIHDFPGRIFEVVEVLKPERKVVHKAIGGEKANLSVRNFPVSVLSLKKKLKLIDGGEDYLFATSLHISKKKVIIHCRKPQTSCDDK